MLPANKCKDMVVINTQKYHSRMQELLSDPVYKHLQGDATCKVEWNDTLYGEFRDKHWENT
jgi:hypothetical protein